MKTISIFGFGHVGRAMYELFRDQVTAIIDPAANIGSVMPGVHREITTAPTLPRVYLPMNVDVNDLEAAQKTDFVFICVPTPSNTDGSCDVSIVENAVDKLLTNQIGIIKSTVTPGTTKRLTHLSGKWLVFSPEYFGESKYYLPPEWAPRAWPFHIFGGPKILTSQCVELFKPLFNPRTFYAQTNWITAEMTKYMENTWGAMKVTWANEWFDICEAFGANYDEVRELWALDPRVEKMHTSVFEDSRGYGGKCFPKDVKAIIAAAKEKGIDVPIHDTVDKINAKRQTT